MSVSHSFIKAFNTVKTRLLAPQAMPLTPEPVMQIQADPGLMQMLAAVLSTEGISHTWQDSYLRLADGMVLAAVSVEVINLAEDKVRSCTRIHAMHATYFPQAISEYQHAMGSTEAAAIEEGFRTWARMDLLVLLDASSAAPKDCTVIEMNVASESAQAEGQGTYRQVVLGPVAHLASLPAPKKKEEHPFCPCCLFTESMPAFHDLLQTQQFLGVRLFASRDNEGKLAADCRVNGEDFLPALDYLKQYAEKWPERGLEFRKQYVVIRSSAASVKQATAIAAPAND